MVFFRGGIPVASVGRFFGSGNSPLGGFVAKWHFVKSTFVPTGWNSENGPHENAYFPNVQNGSKWPILRNVPWTCKHGGCYASRQGPSDAANFGKPPWRHCTFFWWPEKKMVVSDGAKSYPRLHGLLHASCSLAKTIRRHHGTMDGAWRLLKQAIPDQLVTKRCKNKAEINSSLWTYIQTRQWQWEVGHTGDACMKATGKRLS